MSRVLPGIAVFGALLTTAALVMAPARAWPNLLVANIYLLSVALSGALFISMHYLSGARWSVVLRRVAEAMMSALPAAAALMLTTFLGRHSLYPWAQPDQARLLESKAFYLSTPWVVIRVSIVLALWVWLAHLLTRTSRRQDTDPSPSHHRRMIRYSAIFAVVFSVTFAVASVDCLMSLDPRWSSTIYPVYVFAGLLVNGVAVITLLTIALRAPGRLGRHVTASHLHDLGKLLFAFSTFWAYIWLCQYLLIWYGNLPAEISHYVRRTSGPWLPLFVLNPCLNWLLPFLVLLPREAKRSAPVLATISVVLLAGHWLDLYLLVMPEVWSRPMLGPIEIVVPLGHACLFVFLASRALERSPLIPRHDPYLNSSLSHGRTDAVTTT